MHHNLRPYQQEVVEKVREAFKNGHRKILLYAPCAAGKTEMAISFLHATKENNKRSAMILDRIVLCEQTSQRLDKYKVPHGVLQSGHWRYRPEEEIQVCSAQTLEARGSFPDFSLMIIDECHAKRKETIEFIENNPRIRVIGLSASPFTKGLGATYEHIVSSITMRELVDMGHLCPLRVYIAHQVDMTGAKKVAGEWSQKEATERGVKITANIVEEWVKKTHEIYGGARKTIVFCAGVAHGEDLVRQFGEAGYNFVSLSYKDDGIFKQQVIDDFSRDDTEIHGLIATDILTKGFDCSSIDIMVSARPFSKSFSSHVQQLGRGMRSHPGKGFVTLLDHSGNFLRFRSEWEELYSGGVDTLDDEKEKTKKEPTDKEKEASKCPKCGAVWAGNTDVCVHCGHVRVRRNDVIEVAGAMVELAAPVKEKFSSVFKEAFYQGLVFIGREKGFKDGWAYHKYIDKFSIAPAWKKVASPPSEDVRNWLTYQAIKYAKGNGAAQ